MWYNKIAPPGADVVRWDVGEVIRAHDKMELSSAIKDLIVCTKGARR
ncbi:MAG: hypothetical protein OEV74_16895 [Cyclobacteriaceae bacterium]|nr:hypothetical protein [Cyclobacteriaceae bacterium]